jgi:pyruvate dehydrogenase E2 component (dihydrolipoamide acetyltransferase)
MSAQLTAVTIPKWGLAMEEGKITAWFVAEGDTVAKGQDLVDIETTKIANTVESPAGGRVGRIVAKPDETLPVGALLAVLTEGEASAEDIDAFVAGFAVVATAGDGGSAAPEPVTIDAGGMRLRYLKTGPDDGGKLPLVLLHGFFGDLESWMFLRDRLPADRAIYAVDLPGHGGSDKNVGAGTLRELGNAALVFLDAVGVAKAHLIGHSMGGAIAAFLAAHAPARVASVVTIAGAGYGVPVNRDFVAGMLKAQRSRDFRPAAELLFADPGLVNRELLDNLAKFKRLDGVQAALETIAGSTLFAADTDTIAAAIPSAIPALAIFGAQDKIIPPPAAPPEAVSSVTLPVGHMAHMEAPAEIGKAIGAFLADQP